MGRTPKPLVILVTDASMMEWQGIVALKEQQHNIFPLGPWADLPVEERLRLGGPDLIMGPEAWYMDKQHAPYFDAAIKAARARRYPPKPGKKKEDE